MDNSKSSSPEDEKVPIPYQQLWSKVNRLLMEVEYEESLDDYHPDNITSGEWHKPQKELEAHYNTLQKKIKNSVDDAGDSQKNIGTDRDLYQSRLKDIADIEKGDLSISTICSDKDRLTKWLDIWAKWKSLQQISQTEQKKVPINEIKGVGGKLSSSFKQEGYETIGDIRKASISELQNINGIGDKRAQKIYESVCMRPVEDLRGVGNDLERKLLDEGIRKAADLTAVSNEKLTSIDNIGNQTAKQLQGRAAAWLPPRCEPPSLIFNDHQPPYESISKANKNMDELEEKIRSYAEIEMWINQIKNSSYLDQNNFDTDELLLKDSLLNSATVNKKTNTQSEATWVEVLKRIAEYVDDKDESSELPPAVQDEFDLQSIHSADIDIIKVWTTETPEEAINKLNELEILSNNIDKFIEIANDAKEINIGDRKISDEVIIGIESAISNQLKKLQEDIGDDSFSETRAYVSHFCKSCKYAISMSENYPNYPFDTILETLITVGQDESNTKSRVQDLFTILRTANEALDFIEKIDYDHPAIEESVWVENITLALEEEYPQAIQPIDSQLSRLEDGIWDYEDLHAYEWQSFEHLISDLYTDEGYETNVTQSSNDLGVDVWANKEDQRLAIQVKHYQSGGSVGRETLQKLVSTLAKGESDKAIVVTSGDFADTATRYARDFGDDLCLVAKDELVRRLSESTIPPKQN